jgi:hypothetical protein
VTFLKVIGPFYNLGVGKDFMWHRNEATEFVRQEKVWGMAPQLLSHKVTNNLQNPFPADRNYTKWTTADP